MAGAMGLRVGGSPGPWCSQGAGTSWGRSLGWDSSRGPTCAVGLLQEGRGEVQGLGVEGVVVGGKLRVQTLLVDPEPWGQKLE